MAMLRAEWRPDRQGRRRPMGERRRQHDQCDRHQDEPITATIATAERSAPTVWPWRRHRRRHRRQFERGSAVPKLRLDRARSQNPAKIPIRTPLRPGALAYHAPSRMFYTAIRCHAPTRPRIAGPDRSQNRKLVKLHALDCHPHSLSIVSDSTIFPRFQQRPRPVFQPGGDMAIFDIATAR